MDKETGNIPYAIVTDYIKGNKTKHTTCMILLISLFNLECLQQQLVNLTVDEDNPGLFILWDTVMMDKFTNYVSPFIIPPLQAHLQPFINANANNSYTNHDLIAAIKNYLLQQSQGGSSLQAGDTLTAVMGNAVQYDNMLQSLSFLIANPVIQFGLHSMYQAHGIFRLGHIGKLCSRTLMSMQPLHVNVIPPFRNPFGELNINKT